MCNFPSLKCISRILPRSLINETNGLESRTRVYRYALISFEKYRRKSYTRDAFYSEKKKNRESWLCTKTGKSRTYTLTRTWNDETNRLEFQMRYVFIVIRCFLSKSSWLIRERR